MRQNTWNELEWGRGWVSLLLVSALVVSAACHSLRHECLVRGGTLLPSGDGELIGCVRDPNGNVLPGVTVAIWLRGFSSRTAVTDRRGRYEVKGLPEGIYELCVRLEGFGESQVTNVVVAGGTQSYDVVLRVPSSVTTE